MDENLISVVIPVYNIEKWVGKCLSSLIKQSYTDLEIIVVNDGSTDDSLTICEQYQKKDGRIKIISQKNKGLSAARNAGIVNAQGEFIFFVDGDDYLRENAIELAYEAIQKECADMCILQYEYVGDSGEIVHKNEKYSKRLCMSGVEAMKRLLIDDSIGGVIAWGKLYRKTLFKTYELMFPEGLYHEDCFFTYKACFYSSRVVYIPYSGYMYVQRADSIIHTKFSEKHLDKIKAAEECLSFTKINSKENIEASEAASVRWYLQVANRIIRSGKNREKDLNIIRGKIYKIDYKNNQLLGNKYKILTNIYTHNLLLYKTLLLLFKKNDL